MIYKETFAVYFEKIIEKKILLGIITIFSYYTYKLEKRTKKKKSEKCKRKTDRDFMKWKKNNKMI